MAVAVGICVALKRALSLASFASLSSPESRAHYDGKRAEGKVNRSGFDRDSGLSQSGSPLLAWRRLNCSCAGAAASQW